MRGLRLESIAESFHDLDRDEWNAQMDRIDRAMGEPWWLAHECRGDFPGHDAFADREVGR